MAEDAEVQLKLRDGHSSLALSKTRSGIVARGRRDAAELEAKRTQYASVPLSKSRVKKLAEQGNPEAQFDLGMLHRYFTEASSSGHYLVPYGVWSTDEGIAPDGPTGYEEAVVWFRKAADQGHLGAQTWLGCAYQRGEGVDKDCVEAVRWYRKAANQGNKEAQLRLGDAYERGEGVNKDLVEAVGWLRRSASQGYGDA